MAVDADGCARNVGNVVANAANQFTVLLGNGVASGVGNVDDGCARIDNGLQHLEEVQGCGAAGIFGVELNVAHAIARTLYGIHGQGHELCLLAFERLAIALVAELAHDVNVGNANAGVNAGTRGLGERLAAGLDVGGNRPRQCADGRPLDLLRDLPDGIKVFRRRRREAGLDNIHLQPGELARERYLVTTSQAGSRCLFAIS